MDFVSAGCMRYMSILAYSNIGTKQGGEGQSLVEGAGVEGGWRAVRWKWFGLRQTRGLQGLDGDSDLCCCGAGGGPGKRQTGPGPDPRCRGAVSYASRSYMTIGWMGRKIQGERGVGNWEGVRDRNLHRAAFAGIPRHKSTAAHVCPG